MASPSKWQVRSTGGEWEGGSVEKERVGRREHREGGNGEEEGMDRSWIWGEGGNGVKEGTERRKD